MRADALAARRAPPAPGRELLHGVRHRAQVLGHGLGIEAVGGAREVLALDRFAAQVHSRLSVAVSRAVRGMGGGRYFLTRKAPRMNGWMRQKYV